ncbi:MAG: Ig-like domain-containing protein [Pseudomonadota bacterium]
MPPDTALPVTPAALSSSSSGSFTATSTESGSVFEVSLDAAAYSQLAASFTLNALADGAHTVNVRARDAAGNTDATPATFAWTVDTLAPDTTIAASPPTLANSAAGSFTFTSEAGASFQASLDGSAYAAVPASYPVAALSDGSHTLNVRAVDAAGNVDLTPAFFSWQVDTSMPTAQIVFPTALSYTDAAQLHVRGIASDAHTITGVSVNGVAATSTDAFAHWAALVPIAAGTNNLVVGVSDNVGNSNANAATAQVANRGVAMQDLRSLAWDGAHSRVLAADIQLSAVVALRASDGYATVLSDATHGTGPSLGTFFILTVDAANNRAIAMNRGSNDLFAVDLNTGNRTLIPTATPTADTSYLYGIACDSPCTRIYSFAYSSLGDPAVYSIDLGTGARAVISGGQFHQGSGWSLAAPTDIVVDTSGTPRLLISDSSRDAIFAIDMASGNRTVISSANAAIGTVGSGAAFQYPEGMELDAAHNRVLITEAGTIGVANRIVAVDLTTGNRTDLPISGNGTQYISTFAPVLDAANGRLYVGVLPRSEVFQVDLAANQLTRFADSNVGSGPLLAGGSLIFDPANANSLITTALGALVRVNLATGMRSVAATATYAPNSPFLPTNLAVDTRAGVPANRLFMTDNSNSPATLSSIDLGTGTRTTLSTATIPYGSHAEFPLDAPNGRLLINVQLGPSSQIVPINVATGAAGAVIADSTVGTPSFGLLNSMAIENATGQPQRIIATDSQAIMYAFDATTGARVILSSPTAGSGPTLSYIDSLAINSVTRQALAVSGYDNSLQLVNLSNGARSTVSGRNRDDQSIRGSGPPITPLWPRIAADFPAGVAHVTSSSSCLLAVDLVSGDRVITAR